MGLNEVLEDLLAKGRQETQRMREEAAAQRRQILEAAALEAGKLKEKKVNEAERFIERKKLQNESALELEGKRKQLVLQKKILDDVRAQLTEKVEHMKPDEREKVLQHLIKKQTGKKVYCAKKDEHLVAKHSKAQILPANIIGGILVENEEGTLRYDLSFDSLLEEVWTENQKEIAERLFK